MLRRAVLAQIQLEADAYSGRQTSHDPGDDWLCNMGEIMGEQVRWALVAWSEEPPMDRVKMLEEMFRTLRQNGKAHPNMNHGVVESQFSEPLHRPPSLCRPAPSALHSHLGPSLRCQTHRWPQRPQPRTTKQSPALKLSSPGRPSVHHTPASCQLGHIAASRACAFALGRQPSSHQRVPLGCLGVHAA